MQVQGRTGGGIRSRKRVAFRQFRTVYVKHLCCTYPSYLCAHTTFIVGTDKSNDLDHFAK